VPLLGKTRHGIFPEGGEKKGDELIGKGCPFVPQQNPPATGGLPQRKLSGRRGGASAKRLGSNLGPGQGNVTVREELKASYNKGFG